MNPDMVLRRAIIAARSAPARYRPARVQPMAVVVEPAPIVALPPTVPEKTPENAFRVTWYSFPELEKLEHPISKIKRAVSAATGVSVFDMESDRRLRPFVDARQLGMYLARMMTKHSFPAIGRAFGDRDNATARHAIEMVEAKIAADPEFAARVEQIRKAIDA